MLWYVYMCTSAISFWRANINYSPTADVRGWPHEIENATWSRRLSGDSYRRKLRKDEIRSLPAKLESLYSRTLDHLWNLLRLHTRAVGKAAFVWAIMLIFDNGGFLVMQLSQVGSDLVSYPWCSWCIFLRDLLYQSLPKCFSPCVPLRSVSCVPLLRRCHSPPYILER